MPQVTIKGHSIYYNVTVEHTIGWAFDGTPFKMAVPELGCVSCELMKPRGKIIMSAVGSVDTTNASSEITLGFVQSLTSSQRVVKYSSGSSYSETHSQPYPLKDGSGDPWYKDEEGNIETFAAGQGQRKLGISASDEPRFSFPKTNDKVERVVFKDTFIACLVAEAPGVGEATDRYFLHQIDWEISIQGDPSNLPKFLGIRVVSTKDIPSPFAPPAGLKLDGKCANRSIKGAFAKA